MNWGGSVFHRGSIAVWLAALGIALAPGAASAQATRTTPEPAPGGFRVCNKSSHGIEVAKALNTAEKGPPDIISEGWYKLAAGECTTMWPGELKYRYYLLYGRSAQTAREWKGDKPVCVSREPFKIRHGLCETSNNHRNFFQVDTGESKSWTQNLND